MFKAVALYIKTKMNHLLPIWKKWQGTHAKKKMPNISSKYLVEITRFSNSKISNCKFFTDLCSYDEASYEGAKY